MQFFSILFKKLALFRCFINLKCTITQLILKKETWDVSSGALDWWDRKSIVSTFACSLTLKCSRFSCLLRLSIVFQVNNAYKASREILQAKQEKQCRMTNRLIKSCYLCNNAKSYKNEGVVLRGRWGMERRKREQGRKHKRAERMREEVKDWERYRSTGQVDEYQERSKGQVEKQNEGKQRSKLELKHLQKHWQTMKGRRLSVGREGVKPPWERGQRQHAATPWEVPGQVGAVR